MLRQVSNLRGVDVEASEGTHLCGPGPEQEDGVHGGAEGKGENEQARQENASCHRPAASIRINMRFVSTAKVLADASLSTTESHSASAESPLVTFLPLGLTRTS